ncbi:MAG TPA: serine/threonine-protein kinase [Kofleriaceae bacterium]
MRTAADGDAFDRTVIDRRDPLVGTVLDRRFRVDCQLAAGGFGAIYRATDLRSDAEVALKVLLPRLASDPMVVARFRREGKTLAELRDPHTITAYELGEAPDGTLYIVMELLRGESLYERFRALGPLPWRRMLHIARGVCSSLAEAHALGIVHRDLKPANIHLEGRDGDPDFVKVLDFGIAKIVQGNGPEHTQLTQAGQMIGTVDYMSPEQMVGGELTPASDIYTLGVVIYEMISGKTPFADAQSATAILAAVLTQTPEPLSSRVPVPPALDPILARCLEREPENRFGDVGDLVEALARVAAGGAARQAASVPATGFEQTVLTTEATRIDVRYTESSQPVLDARGPRRRVPADLGEAPTMLPPQALTPPAGAATPTPAARGSQHAIDPGQPRDPRRHATPRRAAPAVAPAPTPVPAPGPWSPPRAVPGGTPGPIARSPLPGVAPPVVAPPAPAFVPPAAPPVPVSSYTPPSSYDMIAATSYDRMVRRIIWLAVLIAVIAAVVIATR